MRFVGEGCKGKNAGITQIGIVKSSDGHIRRKRQAGAPQFFDQEVRDHIIIADNAGAGVKRLLHYFFEKFRVLEPLKPVQIRGVKPGDLPVRQREALFIDFFSKAPEPFDPLQVIRFENTSDGGMTSGDKMIYQKSAPGNVVVFQAETVRKIRIVVVEEKDFAASAHKPEIKRDVGIREGAFTSFCDQSSGRIL